MRRYSYQPPYIPTVADITNLSQSPLLKGLNDLNPGWWPNGFKPRSFVKASHQVIKPSIQPSSCFSDGMPLPDENDVPYYFLTRNGFQLAA